MNKKDLHRGINTHLSGKINAVTYFNGISFSTQAYANKGQALGKLAQIIEKLPDNFDELPLTEQFKIWKSHNPEMHNRSVTDANVRTLIEKGKEHLLPPARLQLYLAKTTGQSMIQPTQEPQIPEVQERLLIISYKDKSKIIIDIQDTLENNIMAVLEVLGYESDNYEIVRI